MPCYQQNTLTYAGLNRRTQTGYATEADCLNACKEGVCCIGSECTAKPGCQCTGVGSRFVGVGTTCGGCCTGPCGPSGVSMNDGTYDLYAITTIVSGCECSRYGINDSDNSGLLAPGMATYDQWKPYSQGLCVRRVRDCITSAACESGGAFFTGGGHVSGSDCAGNPVMTFLNGGGYGSGAYFCLPCSSRSNPLP